MSDLRQISLRFPGPALGFDDLAVTSANQGVISAIRRVEHWPYHVFTLIGSPFSGRTTLAAAWAAERQGRAIHSSEVSALTTADLDSFSQDDLAIDDADQLKDYESLLFVISAIGRHGKNLLLTAKDAPSSWAVASADLVSRLKSAPVAQLPAPDEALMRERLRRACKRAYMTLPKAVEDYLVTRLGLDYSQLESVVEALAGVGVDRPLTVPLTRSVLDRWASSGKGDA